MYRRHLAGKEIAAKMAALHSGDGTFKAPASEGGRYKRTGRY